MQNEILGVLEKAKTAFSVATDADGTRSAQREQSLPVRSVKPAAAPEATEAEPNQTFAPMDWGEEVELESDSPSELSDIQP